MGFARRMMLANSCGVGELRERVDRVGVGLVLRLGRRADAAGRDLGVLLLQRGDDVADVEALLLPACIGLSQMRIAYWRWPKMRTCETPETRERSLTMLSWA